MDTRSKKSNSGIITKIIAVILCVFCVAGCTHQVITSLLAYDQADLSDRNFHDVLVYGGKRLDNKDITETQTFRSHFQSYVSNLSEMIGRYSDGSEEAYNEWRTSLDRNTEEQKKRSKQNLISRVVSDDFITYLDLAEDGTVVSLGFLEAAEFSGDENGCDEGSLEGDADYYDLCKNGIGFYNLKTVPEDVQKKADELGADGVIEINDYYKIHSWDYDADEEIIRTTLDSAIKTYEEKEPRGEYVLVLEGAEEAGCHNPCEENELLSLTPREHVERYISDGMSKMDAIKKVAKERGTPKSEIYDLMIEN